MDHLRGIYSDKETQMNTFESLGLSEHSLKALKKKGFEEPTEIQSRCIPLLLDGSKDILGQAQTGTGKTAAFGLPIIDLVSARSRNVQALILTPTRELAIQVAEEISSFIDHRAIRIAVIYGGQSIGMQIGQLRSGAHIVVGTPGRVIDHIQRGTLKLDGVGTFVLDEADEMLNMGFIDEVKTIMEALPSERKTLLFSATMPRDIFALAKRYMREYEQVVVAGREMTSDLTEQIYIEVREYDKIEALRRVIDHESDFYGLVFCRTKNRCDEVAQKLASSGYGAEAFHGDMTQGQREKVLQSFREKRVTVLIATDVAARGIDIQNLTHVINFALPQNPESYVHRIGRTGRAGQLGTAITFVTPDEYRKLKNISRVTGTDITKAHIPSVDQILEKKRQRIISEIEQSVSEQKDEFSTMAQILLETYEPEQLVAGLLRSGYAELLDSGQYRDIRNASPNIAKATRLFIAKGKKHGMSKRAIVEYITKVSGVTGNRIQQVQVMTDFSFASVSLRDAEIILKSFQRSKPGKKSVVTKAKDPKSPAS